MKDFGISVIGGKMGTVIHKLPRMTNYKLTLEVPISINVEELDGITVADISRHLSYCLLKQEANHPPFEIEMFLHSVHKIIDDAIKSAIEENHEERYPGTVPYNTERSTGETACWILTSKKIIRRICHYCTSCWKAKIV